MLLTGQRSAGRLESPRDHVFCMPCQVMLYGWMDTFQSRYIYIYIYIYTVSSFYDADDLYMMMSVMCFNLHVMYCFCFP